MTAFQNDSIFWIEIDKIKPNPYQPRREFDEGKLRDLSESIRQYGVLQPLTVTRRETEHENGSVSVEYELIAGERRLRASKLAKLSQVPALIRMPERTTAENEQMKLELAIIENVQREDLNPIDRAIAFKRLADEFKFSHVEIGKRVGKSREYVSNSIRILNLPDEIQHAILDGTLSDGHSRPLLMLQSRPEEQMVVFKEVVLKKLNVREAELIARRIATDRARRPAQPEVVAIERELTDAFGTRVLIQQQNGKGGRIVISFLSPEDLQSILGVVKERRAAEAGAVEGVAPPPVLQDETIEESAPAASDDDDIYSVRNFSV